MANLRTGKFGNYYGSFLSESVILSQSEMTTNAKYIFSYLSDKGWSVNAISATLGNMQAESSINPGRWQSDDVNNQYNGYGLVQWTPATKYFNWCTEKDLIDPSEMDNNLARILFEVANNQQWIATSSHNLSFSEFTTSNQSVEYLAAAFMLNYERPEDQSPAVQSYRGSLASGWHSVISGETPTPGNPDIPDVNPDTPGGGTGIARIQRKKKFNFVLFNYKRRLNQWTNKPF